MPHFSYQFHFNICIFLRELLLLALDFDGPFDVDEIASVPINAEQIVFETPTFFSLVFGVKLVVFPQLGQSVGEFASLFIRTISIFHKLFAKLRLLLVGLFLDRSLSLILRRVGVALFRRPHLASVQAFLDASLSSQH